MVGLSAEGKPILRVVPEGLQLKLRPVLKENHICLDSELTLSQIRNVETVDLPDTEKSKKSLTVEVPEVATTRINTSVNIPKGGSVLLGDLSRRNTPRNQTNSCSFCCG